MIQGCPAPHNPLLCNVGEQARPLRWPLHCAPRAARHRASQHVHRCRERELTRSVILFRYYIFVLYFSRQLRGVGGVSFSAVAYIHGGGAGAGRPIHHLRRACAVRAARPRAEALTCDAHPPESRAPCATGPPIVCVHGVGGGRAGPRANRRSGRMIHDSLKQCLIDTINSNVQRHRSVLPKTNSSVSCSHTPRQPSALNSIRHRKIVRLS